MAKKPKEGRITDPKKEFVKLIDQISRRHDTRRVFADFLEMAFCAIAKKTSVGKRADDLEARYMKCVGQYERAEVDVFPKLLGLVHLGLDHRDFLGEVAGELNALNKWVGQFFTPYSLSSLLARMTIEIGAVRGTIAEKGFVTMDEPACGAGGMMLAAADVFEEIGIVLEERVVMRGTDVSDVAYKMAYVQCSLRGIPAQLIHGNTLSLDVWDRAVTPAFLRFYANRKTEFDQHFGTESPPAIPAAAE